MKQFVPSLEQRETPYGLKLGFSVENSLLNPMINLLPKLHE